MITVGNYFANVVHVQIIHCQSIVIALFAKTSECVSTFDAELDIMVESSFASGPIAECHFILEAARSRRARGQQPRAI